MKSKLINQENGLRTFILLLEESDEVIGALISFAKAKELGSSELNGLGSLDGLMLGFPDPDFQHYRKIALKEQLEVLCFSGQICLENSGPEARIRVVLGDPEGNTHGGYLLRAHVRSPFEMLVTELPKYMQYHNRPAAHLPST